MSDATYSKIKLNGEDHVLKFDFNAISELEKYYDKGVFGIVTEETIGFNTVRSIIWSGLLWKNANLKIHHVGSMLEKDIEENEELDFENLTKISVGALYESKAFKLLAKRANKGDNSKN